MSVEVDAKMTQVLQLTDKDFKTVFTNISNNIQRDRSG